ncbi:MAG: DUF2723 domain-containing protein [Anaerolineae bacterium]
MPFLRRISQLNYPYALLVFFITFAAYVRTLMPGTVGGDAGELQYAGPLLALVHPTGQPLYVTLGYLWSHIVPFGSMAWRMNLLSAFSAALGCAALTWFFARAYGNRFVATTTGLTLGFGAALWGQAVLADKYGFNVLLTSLLVGLTLWWGHERHSSLTPRPSSLPASGEREKIALPPHHNRLLYVLSLTFGICLLHHRSLALFALMIGVMVVYYERAELWRSWRRTLICAALVLLPALVVYPLFLPLVRAREMSPLLWQPTTASDWLDWLLERHVLTNEALVFDNLSNIASQLQIYLQTVTNDYTLAVVPIALIGFVALLRREFVNGLFLLVSYLLQAFLSANWRGNDRQFTYYLPSFVVLIYAYGYGLYALWNFANRPVTMMGMTRGDENTDLTAKAQRAQRGISRAAAALRTTKFARIRWGTEIVVYVLAVGIVIIQFASTYPQRRADATYGEPLDLWRETLKTGDQGARLTAGMSDVPENAVIAADWEQITMLWYEQRVEGLRPDVTLVYPIERYSEFADRPLCLSRILPVDPQWHLTNVGALVCLNSEPVMTVPSNITPLDATLYTPDGDEQLTLSGYRLDSAVMEAGTHVPLLLTWRAAQRMDADYSISLRILDETWQQVLPSADIAAPVMGMYPTSRWTAGEVVQDYHELDIPPELPAGRYLWTLVIYRQQLDGTFVQLQDAQGNVNILGGTFEVTAYSG